MIEESIIPEIQLEKPILFLIFNRVNEAIKVFDEIRKVKPKKLFIASDGPRLNNEIDEHNNLTIKNYIQENLDWNVEIEYLYREKNLGCKEAVSSAITWFFNKVKEGIILEDDCLPNSDFFRFCCNMLDRYRDDYRIGHICGCNFQEGIKRGDGDYYFSKLTHVWGWASWSTRWELYDITMKDLDIYIKNNIFNSVTNSFLSKKLLEISYKMASNGLINTWDYQYAFTNLKNNKLCIIPNVNLISNIGFNKSGTHTFDEKSGQSNIPLDELPLTIKNPSTLKTDFDADCYTIKKERPPFYIIIQIIVFYFYRALKVKL